MSTASVRRSTSPTRTGITARVAAVQDDLAALGARAPLRALYELGKHSGMHGLTLRLLTSTVSPTTVDVVPALRPGHPLADPVVERCLHDAELIVDEGHRVFGRRVPIRGAADWNAVGGGPPGAPGASWPSTHWWQIDIRSDRRLGDVKWTWELGRHRDLVVLARAAFLRPTGRWAVELVRRLRWWFQAAPAERGVHWYSNLEIALRAVAWMQIHALCSEVLPRDVRDGMERDIARSRRHLLVDFPYTLSSMRNNHLLGDALGLSVIERLAGHGPPSRLVAVSERAFAGQLGRHMRPDGSMIEDSVSYHRFVLEMLEVRYLLGDRATGTVTALGGAAQHLDRLGALDGPVPQWGDWDEGRVLASSGDALDLAGSAALGLALSGAPVDPRWWSDFDEVAWYAPAPGPGPTATAPRAPAPAVVVSGGIARATVGDWTVWLKCGTGPSHQHADLTHVSARLGAEWVLVDPGTGTYNGRLDVRNAFRTSRSHNGLRTRGEEMFVPHRAFRWLTSGTVACGTPARTAGAVVLWGVHDAYSRLDGAGRIVRAVLLTAAGPTVVDWREDGQDALLTVALAPGTEVEGGGLRLARGTALTTHGLDGAPAVEGRDEPFAGWHSPTYGRWERAPWLERSVSGAAATTWGVARAEAPDQGISVAGSRVAVAGTGLGVEFRPGGATLIVTADGRTRMYPVATGDA